MTSIIGNLIGGVGLLLIGIMLMTDGLKLASGNALREILGRWTQTRWRGLLAGALITGIVQSSNAVTVATIGFANAGMLTLERAIWVVYGSNVGSTMIGWLVALVGFEFDIHAIALPCVGLGAFLRLTGGHSRRGALGTTLVGFGLLFLGISIMEETFIGLQAGASLPAFANDDLLYRLMYVGVGVALAAAMQSSSATLVITLSAVQGGLIPFETAAAIVIGANVGATTTSMLSVIGATPNAKRVALSHVMFNVTSAIAGFITLTPVLWLMREFELLIGLDAEPAVRLALFHSAFNISGVILIWPLSGRLIAFLRRHFSSEEEQLAKPRHLDRSVLALPYVAAEAVVREVERLNQHTLAAFRISLRFNEDNPPTFTEHRIVRQLSTEVHRFTVKLAGTELTPVLADTLAALMESTQQYLLVIDIVEDMALMSPNVRRKLDSSAHAALDDFVLCIDRHLAAQNLNEPATLRKGMDSYDDVETYYRVLKDAILRSATHGDLAMEEVDLLLQFVNQAKRGCRQLAKATQRVIKVRDWLRLAPES
jgi:phosphate:Na+ symporter